MSAITSAGRVRFTPSVILTREEAFTACQTLADADRCLVGVDRGVEAGALGALFDLLEDRLTATPDLSTQALSGSYSIDSEFTQ